MTTWQEYAPGTSYRVLGHLFRDGSGFTIVGANLPGLASQGDSVPEALANFREAAEGLLLTYRDEGREPPWKDCEQPECSLRVAAFVRLEQ